jgi:hypothetical protein
VDDPWFGGVTVELEVDVNGDGECTDGVDVFTREVVSLTPDTGELMQVELDVPTTVRAQCATSP